MFPTVSIFMVIRPSELRVFLGKPDTFGEQVIRNFETLAITATFREVSQFNAMIFLFASINLIIFEPTDVTDRMKVCANPAILSCPWCVGRAVEYRKKIPRHSHNRLVMLNCVVICSGLIILNSFETSLGPESSKQLPREGVQTPLLPSAMSPTCAVNLCMSPPSTGYCDLGSCGENWL